MEASPIFITQEKERDSPPPPYRPHSSPLKHHIFRTAPKHRPLQMYDPEDLSTKEQLEMHISLAQNLVSELIGKIWLWNPLTREMADPYVMNINLYIDQAEAVMGKITKHEIDLVEGRRMILSNVGNLQRIEKNLDEELRKKGILMPERFPWEPEQLVEEEKEGGEKQGAMGKLKRAFSLKASEKTKRRVSRVLDVAKDRIVYGQPSLNENSARSRSSWFMDCVSDMTFTEIIPGLTIFPLVLPQGVLKVFPESPLKTVYWSNPVLGIIL
ncbi:hypothetical protein L873DRAFT_1848151 [Choiromyces venosus 120613-1]|uniref:Uncharacterized protein n=1 Tax=Choiromyces venosus 120613-1 TaxID=1336337 RepID=A0A3N4IZP0_9PEZI|nr:hypothetical protein L873DRAFT_1848151 [Choiromyces venosus 120613-1]